jgi:hypothetical protein
MLGFVLYHKKEKEIKTKEDRAYEGIEHVWSIPYSHIVASKRRRKRRIVGFFFTYLRILFFYLLVVA